MAKVVVNFRKESAAAEFAANFSILDGKASVRASGTKAVVSSSNPKVVEMVRHMARNVLEERGHRDAAEAMLDVVLRSFSGNRKIPFVLSDGSEETMTPVHAEAFARIHDRLSGENQTAFLLMAGESRDSYAAALGFALRNEEKD